MEIEDHLFKKIKFLESPNFNNRPVLEEIRLIVIHSISLPPNIYGNTYVEDFFLNKLNISDHKYFNEIKDLKVSSHIYIKRNGEVIQFVPFDKRAWHAGESSYMGVPDCNDYSIGIELEGFNDDIFSEEQYNSLIIATKEILKEYPMIKKDNITGHSNVAPNRKTDPGNGFDWKRYLNLI
tara:strand:- start:2761 stop:3300 length:540 start_codon:yes stop_codon:yes gene_type:complete